MLEEFGTHIPDHMEMRVRDSTADLRYIVLPQTPEGTQGMGEEELAKLVTRDSMIGVRNDRETAGLLSDLNWT